jgi:hypothetical protein
MASRAERKAEAVLLASLRGCEELHMKIKNYSKIK